MRVREALQEVAMATFGGAVANNVPAGEGWDHCHKARMSGQPSIMFVANVVTRSVAADYWQNPSSRGLRLAQRPLASPRLGEEGYAFGRARPGCARAELRLRLCLRATLPNAEGGTLGQSPVVPLTGRVCAARLLGQAGTGPRGSRRS
jgi:hypothetical protein